ncbi:MAG: 1-acyl-sn-glycerol-3-phosphate acyltransferase [Bacilli bacterium]|nr:1-acyl-sn-glycerol-3-phosphate acyltransferase [Bacilli bacterium]
MPKNKEDHKLGYTFFRGILGILFMAYYRPKIINKKVIPKKGPIIVCGNHIHLYDQCMPILSTRRMLHYMAKKEYFDGKKAWFFKASGCISVNRSIHDSDAKEKALEVLKNGYALGIFPEGTRNKTDAVLLPFKMGAVSMAQKTGATIVPYAITGKYKFWNNKLTCTFLEPFKVGPDDDLEKVNEKLRNMIYEVVEKSRNDS